MIPRKERAPDSSPRSESQRTNELLEKLIVLHLKDQGIPQESIAKFIGKKRQSVTEMLRALQVKSGER